MATINTGDIIRLVLTFTMPSGTVSQNIYHYAVDALTDPDSNNVINDFLGRLLTMYTHIEEQMSDQVVGNILDMYVRDTVNNEWTLVEAEQADVISGNSGFQMLPHGNAALVSALATNNRSYGKKYLPGFVEEAQTASIWTPQTLGDLALFAAGYADAFIGGSGTYSAGLWSEKNLDFTPFIGGAIVNGLVAYQRRRKPGVGI